MQVFRLFTICALALATFTSCEQLNQLTVFDFGPQTTTFILNETEAGEITFEREISVNIQKELDDRGYTEDKIESIRPKTVTISLSNSDSDFSLSNITDATIEIATTNKSAQSVAELVSVISRDATSVNLEVNDVELRDYLLEDKISYQATFTTDATAPQDAQVSIAVTYEVDIKLL